MFGECNGCTERKVGCHADCEFYRNAKKLCEEMRQQRIEENKAKEFLFASKERIADINRKGRKKYGKTTVY